MKQNLNKSNITLTELILQKETKDKVSNNVLYRTIQNYNIPSSEQYNNLLKLIDVINDILFYGKLPGVMLSFSNRAGKCGKIENENWQNIVSNSKLSGTRCKRAPALCHEIIIDTCITKYKTQDILISLVHTLCHFQQIIINKTSRSTYHNTDFSERMRQMGLTTKSIENNLGTGQNVIHEVIKGGSFEKLFLQLKNEDFLPWQIIAKFHDAPINKTKNNSKNKIAYKCEKCNTKVWGKHGLNINCNKCNKAFKQMKQYNNEII